MVSAASREVRRERALARQRARLLDAMAEVVAVHGLRGASAARVARRAGVSRATLAEQFESLDACFLELLDWLLGRVAALTAEAFERERSWSDGVLAWLEALLKLLDEEPVRARVCLLESMAVPGPALRPRLQALGRLGLLIDERARRELSLERQPPRRMYEATIGLVLGLLRRRLLSGEAPPFVVLLGQLAETIVAPYLGPSAAAEVAVRGDERAQALLKARSIVPEPPDIELPSLLRHGNAHRMRSCIRYLAGNPGASNREVAAALEISHAGQVSALLSRLHDGGLLEKKPGGAGRPNAWRLSPFGVEVARALHRW